MVSLPITCSRCNRKRNYYSDCQESPECREIFLNPAKQMLERANKLKNAHRNEVLEEVAVGLFSFKFDNIYQRMYRDHIIEFIRSMKKEI